MPAQGIEHQVLKADRTKSDPCQELLPMQVLLHRLPRWMCKKAFSLSVWEEKVDECTQIHFLLYVARTDIQM